MPGGLELISRLLQRIFYNPSRHARRLPFVSVGDNACLLPQSRFEFHTGSETFAGRVSIGDGSIVGGEFVFESSQGEVTIGTNTFINSGTRMICRRSIQIGSNVTIAWGCTIYDHNSHSLEWRVRAADHERLLDNIAAGRPLIDGKNWESVSARPIIIADKAWLGFGVTVLAGVTIGEGAIVAAGSVVRDDVAPWTVVTGNPAVHLKDLRRS